MSIVIEEHYAKTALKIMKNYDEVLREKDVYLKYILALKDSCLKMKDSLDDISNDPKNTTDLKKNSELYKKI